MQKKNQDLYLELVNKANYYLEKYDLGEPEITDQEWDRIYYEIKRMEETGDITISPASPTQAIVYKVVNELKKVAHNHPMLSLDKTKEIEKVETFIGEEQDFLAMAKMDGLTCSLRYVDGELVSAETRGDGVFGEDILHNAMVIPSIPKKIDYEGELVVDGEIICTYKDFEEFKDTYKNPRNFAAGSIRLLNSKECEKRHLTFVAWDVIKGFKNIDNLNHVLLVLADMGFTPVPYIMCEDKKKAAGFIKEVSSKKYPIDGVVFKFNSRSYGAKLGRTEHHFKNAIAYKFYDETYPTEAERVEWTMGRTGVLTPVVVFKPIEIEGSIVSRASAHNLARFKDLKLRYQGQKIDIYKANLIIPQIAKVYPYEQEFGSVAGMEIPMNCPICGKLLDTVALNDTENLMCLNPDCEGKLVNKLDHFCSKKGLDIKGLSKVTLGKLIDWGWIGNIHEIYSLSNFKEEWIKKPGFGVASVTKILDAIEQSKNCRLNSFISALGIPLVGRTVSREIVKYYSTWDDFREATKSGGDWTVFNGFGEEISKALNTFDYTVADEVAKLLTFEVEEPSKKELLSNGLKDLTFCITGKVNVWKNRTELKDYIESRGGRVVGSMSSKVNYLINNDKESGTAKNRAAKDLGIDILSEADFLEAFGQK